MYEIYRKHPQASKLIKKLKIHQTESKLLWIVDVILQATLPFNWTSSYEGDVFYVSPQGKTQTEHPALQYFIILIEKIRISASQLEPGSILHRFTCQPPAVVIDVLNMLFYLNSQPSTGKEFAAMLAISAPISNDFMLESGHYISKITRETFPANPDDAFFCALATSEILQAGHVLIPKLTAAEAKLLPNGKILVYDFDSLRPAILGQNGLKNVKRIKMPFFEFDWHAHENIFLGVEKANQIVFDGNSAVQKASKTVPYGLVEALAPRNLAQFTLNLDANLPEISENLLPSAFDFGGIKAQKCEKKVQKFEKIKNISDQNVNSNLNSVFHSNSDKSQFSLAALQRGYETRQKPFYEPLNTLNQPLPNDHILQQILDPPPPESVFYATLTLDRAQIQQMRENARADCPIDAILSDYRRRNLSALLQLNLTVKIAYSQKLATSEFRNPEPAQGPQDDMASKTVIPRLAGNENAKSLHLQPPILTENVISYSVNGRAVAAAALPYKATIADFCIGRLVICGAHKFVISRADAMTKFWYGKAAVRLNQMRNRVDVELMRSGIAWWVSRKAKFCEGDVAECRVCLREISDLMLEGFQRLSAAKPDVKLRMFQ
ncbi:hypothetical protein SS50377_25021 [Spironucleus salmonicida]|uniref:Uncharacterized protein n=1 Tax=Spironucleus salmonicida TaxID=348837 RepID=V6LQP2_9EUKA|nr:hypothetical protein SS50377_25021 [Spironucleus salmonicida]|eukprot:EST43074.1 Hypothetical protein SS50377_17232 [Spironucleus salmonicida]